MTSLNSEREVTKFFSISSISLRPDACEIIMKHLHTIQFSDYKRDFLDKFIRYFKELQTLNIKNV